MELKKMEGIKILHNELDNKGIRRRNVLKALGIGSVGVALSTMLGPEAILAKEVEEQAITIVDTQKELVSMMKKDIYNGKIVYVKGYKTPNDGGDKLMRYVSNSHLADNKGTVIAPLFAEGRWHIIHNGIGDFRWFGIFNDKVPADNALDELIKDRTIRKIQAHTDLLFVKRHKYERSDLKVDFMNYKVSTIGMEDATPNDPFAALLYFEGKVIGELQSVILTETLADGTDIFEVSDASKFVVGEWYIVKSDIAPIPSNLEEDYRPRQNTEREIEKMLSVTQIVDSTHVRFNYHNGWAIAAGRKLTYIKVKPVRHVHINNMHFEGNGHSDISGCSPVAYQYAVDCNNNGIHATKTFWPMIMRRYCYKYVIQNCTLINPEEIRTGGTGYLTQQIFCVYAHVKDCLASNARHLNDFTGSAYGLVENCHMDGDDNGAFVTHGQYEHDLVYVGNSGIMSFANSGVQWGERAKRITVKKHLCTRFIAARKVSDLTIEDVHVYEKAGLANSGSMWLNVDGLTVRNCSCDTMICLTQIEPIISSKTNLIDQCSFKMVKGYFIGRDMQKLYAPNRTEDVSVKEDITFSNCKFIDVDNNYFSNARKVIFNHCEFLGVTTHTGSSLRIEAQNLFINNCIINV